MTAAAFDWRAYILEGLTDNAVFINRGRNLWGNMNGKKL
jgi:hypothetical protein